MAFVEIFEAPKWNLANYFSIYYGLRYIEGSGLLGFGMASTRS